MSNVSDIIDSVIASGYMTSVDVYKTFEDSEAERKYILKYHLDEELEQFLMCKAMEDALTPKPDKPPY